ncbi:hypothetical protein NY98_12325 [Xanthomonas citri pv. fuscans]|uniref:Uncharacterized protein n=1 Tax=Xanthomonas citri pv. fuscans TaxID=366649 RepID=A0AB34Q814_XANCI|nr:hypothetical protein AC613_10460 [Xanthomonas citri pv. fuscans]AZU23701.1 hypothetical protein AC612_10460 [Xanthomonas citri pv. fuscans]AZU92762.1 hypothetical protein AC614_10465 [Xanthomonas citri pv. fuscans]KGU52583.1 hypothetical protein NY98_12325 [Xanthomonas citri pv. fuscans]
MVELFKSAPGPGTFPSDDLTREFGNSTDFLVVCQGRLPDAGLTVWVSFGAQRFDGSDRRIVGDLRAPWDGQYIDPACVLLLDGETVSWSTFATVFWNYLDLPPMRGPTTRQHEEIARLDRETTELLRATGRRLLGALQLG